MLERAAGQIRFDFFLHLPIEVQARDIQVSRDAGILPIPQLDDQIGCTRQFIACRDDMGGPERLSHTAGGPVFPTGLFIGGSTPFC